MYEVVYPLGRLTQNTRLVTSRLNTLDGMTIGELSNHKFNCELTFAIIEKAMIKRFPKVKFVSHEMFGDMYGSKESEVIKSLPGRLKEFGVDAVISGNAG